MKAIKTGLPAGVQGQELGMRKGWSTKNFLEKLNYSVDTAVGKACHLFCKPLTVQHRVNPEMNHG